MAAPLVSAVMLVCGRPEMTARAVRAFEAQAYEPKEPVRHENKGEHSIGLLRNAANQLATGEIICHFDSDDWSHPARIAEQVALLRASGADAVGFREMLFWREPNLSGPALEYFRTGEAWRYSNPHSDYIVGASLCYRRRTWERKPFADVPHGQRGSREDSLFIRGLKVASTPGFAMGQNGHEPRLIASIHAGNTGHYAPESDPSRWRRAPEWDDYCRERMKL